MLILNRTLTMLNLRMVPEWCFTIKFSSYLWKRMYRVDVQPHHKASFDSELTEQLALALCVWSLCWEDILEKGMTTHSSILAWRIPWTEEPGRLQSMGSQRVRRDWATNPFTFQGWQGNFWDLMRHLAIDSLRFSFLGNRQVYVGIACDPRILPWGVFWGKLSHVHTKTHIQGFLVAALCIWMNSPC